MPAVRSRKTFIFVTVIATLSTVGWSQTESVPAVPVDEITSFSTMPSRADSASPYDSAALVQPAPATGKKHPPISARRDGLWLSTADGSTQLHVHGYLQADNRMFNANTHDEQLDTFSFRRIRPLFEGTIFDAVDFRFMPDFGQNNPQIQEAYLEEKTFDFAKVRVGKFKEPIGLEVLRSDRELVFAERSMTSDLVPLRYIGAQLGGSLFTDAIEYQIGYFNGSADNSNGEFTQWSLSHETVARIFLRPFATTAHNWMRDFGFGLAGSVGTGKGAISGMKTVGQSTFFKYHSSTVADGEHDRLSPQAYYYAGPFGLLGEYVVSSQRVLNESYGGNLENSAWQAAGSVVLTGEKNSYAGIRPRNATEHVTGVRRLGALEIAVRYSQLAVDRDAFPRFADVLTSARVAREEGIGVNWYLNRYIKLVTNYEHTGFKMARGNTTALHSENVLMSRIHLAF